MLSCEGESNTPTLNSLFETMHETRTAKRVFRGFWWMPANPDVEWYGKLKWQQRKSPSLKLRYKSELSIKPPDGAEALLGRDSSGAPLTLLRVGFILGTSSGYLSATKYNGGHLIKGIHFASLQEIRLNRVSFRLQYLGDWLSEEGFSRDDGKAGATRIKYERPPDRKYQLSKNVTFKICHSAHSSSKARKRDVSYDIFFSFESERQFDFKRAMQWIDAMRSFLHFARLRKVFATSIEFEKSDYRFQLGEETYPETFELFNASIARQPEKQAHFPDFVFTFADVQDRMGDLISKWLRFSVEQREALGCYITTVYGNLTSELQLISLTQGLEAFHERRYRPEPKTEASYFVNRIKALCQKQELRMIKVVGDLNTFAEAVRDSRHYYTHHDPSLKQKGNVLSGSKLIMMTYHLQYLFRLCVLSEFALEADPHSMLRRQIPNGVVEFY